MAREEHACPGIALSARFRGGLGGLLVLKRPSAARLPPHSGKTARGGLPGWRHFAARSALDDLFPEDGGEFAQISNKVGELGGR